MAYSQQQIEQINAAREANYEAGRNVYSGAGGTAQSREMGLGNAPVGPAGENLGTADSYTSPSAQYQTPPSTTQETPAPTQQTQTQPPTGSLKPGSSGTDVQALQNYLVQQGYLTPQQISSGPGIYGPQTTAAVAKMQKDLGVQAGGAAGYYGPQTQQAIAKKYQGVYSAVSGTTAPQSQSEASAIIAQQTQPSTDPVFNSMSNTMGPILDSLNQILNNIYNPALTATSLQTEYNTLAAQNNLPQMQSELLNYQNIMNGTEQDIRDEITSAGGTATESQVLGMTSARNKVILKQYNALATNYQAAQTNVSNMMQYASTDKSTELQRQSTAAGISESMASIEQSMINTGITMQQNAVSNYQNTIKRIGYVQFAQQVPASMKPHIESILGMTPGYLSDTQALQAADLADPTRQALKITGYDQNGNPIYSAIPKTGTQTTTPSTSGVSDTTTGSTVVGGIDFGVTAAGVQPYATDVQSEVSGVSRAYNDITSSFGNSPTADQLQSYISDNAPNSPVTGQMITSSAQKYGIPPAILAALLNNESGFGTVGAGAKTMNPGNVGNTDTTTQDMGSWQNGVDQAAQQLSRRVVPSGTTQYPPSQTMVGATGTAPVSSTEYGLLSKSTSFNPNNQLDQRAWQWLNTYIYQGIDPTPSDVGLSARVGTISVMTQVKKRAQDLLASIGQTLPDQNILQSNKKLLASNNAMINSLAINIPTIRQNSALLQQKINAGNINQNAPAINAVIDPFIFALGNPDVASYIAQNQTLSNELGSLLALKGASGSGASTVHDKLVAAGLIDKNSSAKQEAATVNTILQEAGNAVDAITSANRSLYTQIDPLQKDLNNPININIKQIMGAGGKDNGDGTYTLPNGTVVTP